MRNKIFGKEIIMKRSAIVTGASSGIGLAVSSMLVKKGYSVYGIARHFSDSDIFRSELFYPIECDITETQHLCSIVKKIMSETQLFILVNNAGITCDKLMLSMKSEEFNRVIGVNLTGCFNATKQVYGVMAKKRSGRIINISSVAGIMGNAGQTNYAASKAGVIGLTKSVAKELAPRGVCCNAICPGFVSTDMTSEFENNEAAKAAIPLGRFGKPEEIAALCAFLCSDGGAYITGQTVTVDGGMCM